MVAVKSGFHSESHFAAQSVKWPVQQPISEGTTLLALCREIDFYSPLEVNWNAMLHSRLKLP
jgi:hypothetical protein